MRSPRRFPTAAPAKISARGPSTNARHGLKHTPGAPAALSAEALNQTPKSAQKILEASSETPTTSISGTRTQADGSTPGFSCARAAYDFWIAMNLGRVPGSALKEAPPHEVDEGGRGNG